ncbi:c-type cytochrome biogenesis protein CcsB, partial [Rhodococcus sp. NPDC058514]
MPINETIAQYSDWAFESAFAIYVLAFVLLIAQYATARANEVQAREARELVAAGGGAVATATPSVPGKVIEA